MRCRFLALFLLSLSLPVFLRNGAAQEGKSADSEANTRPAPQLPADAPVIVVESPCASSAATADTPGKPSDAGNSGSSFDSLLPPVTKDGGTCKIVITRAQFEQLANTLQPHGSPWTAQNFAAHYAEMLLLTEKAHETGFDQQASLQLMARFGYLQLVSQSFGAEIKEKARNVSDAEVESYYKEHPEMFDRIDVIRVFIPAVKEYATGSSSSEKQLAADKAEMEAVAHRLYKQALAGESFAKLEERAYKASGNPEDTPTAQLGKLTRNKIPDLYREMLFGLEVGKVSPLVTETNGWSIFKVVSKDKIPLSGAKVQVQQIRSDAAVDVLKSASKLNLNQDYFGPPAPSTKPPRIHP